MGKAKRDNYSGKKIAEYKDGTRAYEYPGGSIHIYGPHLGVNAGVAESHYCDDYFWAALTSDYGTTLLKPGQSCSARHGVDIPELGSKDKYIYRVALAWVQGGTKRARESNYELERVMAICDTCLARCWANDDQGYVRCYDCRKKGGQ